MNHPANHRLGLLTAACLLCSVLFSACRGTPRGLVRPTGVAVASDGSLFIMDHVDRNHSRVLHTTASGKIEAAFEPKGQGGGHVYAGWDIAIGPDGTVYYCNLISNNERVLHDGLYAFSPSGKFLFEFGAYDYGLDSNDLAHVPYNLDVDQNGLIYVTDFNDNELRVFDPRGRLQTVFTRSTVKHFDYEGIGDVAVDDRRGLVYLVDYFAGRLDQYQRTILPDGTPALTYQWSVGAYGHGPQEFSFPQYLALDETTGMVFVGDMGNRRIVAVDPQGSFVARFAPSDVEDWQVLGLDTGEDPDHPGNPIVYAADAVNRVIWAFTPGGQFLRKIEVH